MRVLVTGSSGFVGIPLCLELATRGVEVHALVRKLTPDSPLRHPNIKVFVGDIEDPASLDKAVKGCEGVYHLAAFTGIWTRDKQQFHKVNVVGTNNVLAAALRAGVKRVVVTSTAGVMGPSPGEGQLVDESTDSANYWATDYEITKRESEKLAFGYLSKGLDVMVVNPSRVYGPGLLKETNSVTRLVKMYREGKWRFIPGDGNSRGNYVYIDDVVHGHLLAMEKGLPGERYILGGDNISYNGLFGLIKKLTGKNYRLFHLPLGLMLLFARIQVLMADWFGRKPLIVPALVKKYTRDWNLSSRKAQTQLGYTITPIAEGLKKTLDWIVDQDSEGTQL